MIDEVKKKVDHFNSDIRTLKKGRKNKTSERGIEKIAYQEVNINDRIMLLLKVTAFNTNYNDGFFEKINRIDLTKESKIGSDNNFILLCPIIYGDASFTYSSNWAIFVYDDPNKDNGEMIATTRLVLTKVLNIKIKNIKLHSALEKIRKAEVVKDAIVRVTTIDNDMDSGIPIFSTYLIGNRTKVITESFYRDLPAEDAIKLLNVDQVKNLSFNSVKRLILNENKEIKVTQSSEEEASEKIKETIEEIFNSEVQITEDELQNYVYNPNFVIEKLKPVFHEFIRQNK